MTTEITLDYVGIMTSLQDLEADDEDMDVAMSIAVTNELFNVTRENGVLLYIKAGDEVTVPTLTCDQHARSCCCWSSIHKRASRRFLKASHSMAVKPR